MDCLCQEYKVETSSTRFESSRSGNATYDFKTFTTTQEGKNDGVFYDSNVMSKEAGQERVFNIQGFPADIQISEVGQIYFNIRKWVVILNSGLYVLSYDK